MICIKLEKAGDILYSDLSEVADREQIKTIQRTLGDLTITIVATGSEQKILSSKRHIQSAVTMCTKIANSIKSIESEQGNRYTIHSHNLITTHSRLQDAVESVIPERSLASAQDHAEQIIIVKTLLEEDISHAAEALLNIVKRVVDLQAQIEGFKILSGGRKLDIGEHNILKVLQNIIHPFYADLLSNNVSIKWHIDPALAELKQIKTDYKALNVILHHLLTNAVKYTKPYSCIDINFDFGELELSLSMKSIRIEQDELLKIFEMTYRGGNVPAGFAGEGVGMYVVKRAADFLHLSISVQPDYSAHNDETDGVRYCPNTFILKGLQLSS